MSLWFGPDASIIERAVSAFVEIGRAHRVI